MTGAEAAVHAVGARAEVDGHVGAGSSQVGDRDDGIRAVESGGAADLAIDIAVGAGLGVDHGADRAELALGKAVVDGGIQLPVKGDGLALAGTEDGRAHEQQPKW